MNRKLKAFAVAAVIIVSLAGLVVYDAYYRTVSVTFEAYGLPSDINWSVTLLQPPANINKGTGYPTHPGPSPITFNGLQQNTWYAFIPNYTGLYFANYGLNYYVPPQIPWPVTLQPLVFNTGSGSTTVKLVFNPYINLDRYAFFAVVNNTTYPLFNISTGGIIGFQYGPIPSAENVSVLLNFFTGPRNSSNVTELVLNNGKYSPLWGSYDITSVSFESNSSLLSYVGTNLTLPWQVTPSSTPFPDNITPSFLVTYHVPYKPVIAWTNFTFTIDNWNPNAT